MAFKVNYTIRPKEVKGWMPAHEAGLWAQMKGGNKVIYQQGTFSIDLMKQEFSNFFNSKQNGIQS